MANERILVVEDEPPVAQLIERALKKSGYLVCAVASTGEAALDQAAQHRPDLVLMDITLPGRLDGVETAERLHGQFDVPVVFLTGLADDATVKRARQARAFGYVLKPFRREELQASIEIALNKHRVESRLRRMKRWFSAAIQSVGEGVITTDEQGIVTSLNPIAATLTGWSLEEALGQPMNAVAQLFDPRQGGRIYDPLAALAAGGPSTRFTGTLQLRARQGTETPIEATADPIRNDQGQVFGAVLTFRDVTDRLRAEAALRKSEERFHAFMDNSPVIAFIKDEAGHYLFGNRAWAARFGRPVEELLGRTDFELWPEESARLFRHSDATALSASKPIEWIESAVRADGSPYHAMIFKFVLRDDAGRKLVGGLALDITSAKEAEAEVSRSREQLRSLAAHLQTVREEERAHISREIHDQLGQMLTGLKMDLAWLERRLHALPAQAAHVPLFEKTKSMTELLDQMVKSVRKISADLRPGVLDDLGLVPALEWQAREFQIRTGIHCELISELGEQPIPPDLGTAAFRIFQETLTNVARHAQATAVEAQVDAQAGHLVLAIQDNGRGITQKEMLNLKSLGLLGMRERATILGGDFKITGAPGQGTTVTVRIPLRKS